MRRFFWETQTYVKIDVSENNYIFMLKTFVLSKPVCSYMLPNASHEISNHIFYKNGERYHIICHLLQSICDSIIIGALTVKVKFLSFCSENVSCLCLLHIFKCTSNHFWPGHIALSVTCLTADPGVASSIQTRSHTFVEIDHEIITTAILLPSTDSRRVVVSYKRKYVHEVLVNGLVKLAQE